VTKSDPPARDDEDDDRDGEDAFLREVARVDAVPPPSSRRSSESEQHRVSSLGPPLGPPFAPLLVGQRIGRFRVLGELGRGGMGIVYLAHDDQLQRSVALKVLVTSLTRHEERRRRFLREGRVAASVTHPNLATIYDVGEDDGRIFIAMERVEGQTLRRILASRRLTVDETLDLTTQILAGLAKAHQAGVVHRDLKPDNVMVTDDGVVKLLDFGLAKLHRGSPGEAPGDSAVGHDTADHQVVGTPSYMSPEQARGQPVDARSDIFAVGVMLYEMLSGRRPFMAENEADLLTAILRDAPEALSRASAQVPVSVRRIVERCLEKDPDRRYQTCGAIASDLARSSGTRPGRSPMSQSSPVGGLDVAALPATSQSRRAPRLRRPVVALALALAATLVAGFVIRSRRQTAPVAATGPRPTAVTDLPLPASRSPEALSEYAAAMQGFRDGNWGYVYEHLERAVTLDPSLAAAHLRLAIVHRGKYPSEARVAFARALLGRGTLSERDQSLLAAYEPILNRDPPNQDEWQARLRAATERYPGDAELFCLLSYALWQDPEAALRAARRSVELDPQYADGWQGVGESLADLGKIDEALVALDRCVTLSPAAADCRGERGAVRGVQGHCAEMEEDFRRAVASSKSGVWHDGRAAALLALGRPPEAVLEVFRNKWAQLPAEGKAVTELRDRSRLDIALGQFRNAEAELAELNRLISSDSVLMLHAEQTLRLVAIYTETNRPREAAAVADDYLKRNEGWIGSGQFDGTPMIMLWALLRGGKISHEAFASRRDEWIVSQRVQRGAMKGVAPLATYAHGLQTQDEARAALRLFPQVDTPTVTSAEHPTVAAGLGRLYLLAGRPRDALPYLRQVVNDCDGLRAPVEHVRSACLLGQALEATGDTAGACTAYARVLHQWGDASPPSLTAARARDRSRALHCPDPSGVPLQ
jgi:serine/threonine-protein kinase